mgnify:FL=1
MTYMTTKDIFIALKRDECDSISYLMQKFGFLQKGDLFENIRKISPSAANELIRKLEKKQKRSFKRVVENTQPDDEQPVASNSEVLHEYPEQCKEKEDVSISESLTDSSCIEKLQSKEQQLSQELCVLEGFHKDLVSKRRILVEKLGEAKTALEEFLKQVKDQEQNVTFLYKQYLECADEMEDINQERRNYETSLESIRKQLSELQKISILVYQDTSIEIISGKAITIPNQDDFSALDELVNRPEAGELTINELKTIIKLQKIVDSCENKGIIEFVFDNPKLENFWNTLTM